ncbi:GGDEF domain-containing protein/uncharacterized protein (DUF2147 family) [Clostridium acetobutylicum]|uniref:GGDEF domain-containing protein n=1 Tax=Clostridium TaxID=1485 RepID=UPI000200C23C|nr:MULTISPECIES: GGDEF domain-containing protein [Clostridium]ADZ21625.1 GGDEF domain containing protein [Clostridium acetobutylicum EA 2018]AEI32442.1 GGDEF domain-containing protein [Clostridium acetobutylicum DSM 1731]AWV79056.1 GGDEF domain-containing protein [Clostridium acetobutylicum]MBC2394983.1 GGDEF domain-containing protein [Clostridium acetobutylicum]MBC2585277.1 GGDEF domain-containing protein [Clostridium acetobutylicum]
MEDKKKFILKVFLIFVVSVFLICIFWYSIIKEININKSNIIKFFMEQQYLKTNEIGDRVQYALKASDEKKVVDDILKKETNSKNNYVFLYSKDGVVFERNDTNTSRYKNKSLKQFFFSLEYNGGENLSYMKRSILSGGSGYDEVIRKGSGGKEIDAWYSFKSGEKLYTLGTAVSKDYLIRATCIDEHRERLIIFSSLITLILIIISCAFLLHIYFATKNILDLEKTIRYKNLHIESFIEKLSGTEESLKKASIRDSLTGVYNMEFFYKILDKINMGIFMPIAVIVVEAFPTSEEVISEAGKVFYGNDIVSRIDYNKFAIIKLNTNREEAFKFMDNVKHKTNYTFIYGISVKEREEGKIIMNVRSAAEKIKLWGGI